MRISTPVLSALLLALGLSSSALAQETYVRYEQGPSQTDGALQTAVAHFKHPTKNVEIVLYGVVHIADMDYYQRVQADLDSYDVVLYEGVAPGKTAPTEEDQSLGDLQKTMGELLGLSFQKDGIDYTRENLVHADMNMDQLKEAMGGNSINPLGGVMDPKQMKRMVPMFKMIGQFGKMFMDGNPRMRDQLKGQMGRQMGNADMSKALGSEKMTQVILIDRNKVVMEVLAKQLETTTEGTIAIFYGAAHNPDFEQRLSGLGFTQTSKRWMSAWKVGDGVESSLEEAPAATTTRERAKTTETPEPVAPKSGPRWF